MLGSELVDEIFELFNTPIPVEIALTGIELIQEPPHDDLSD